MRTTLFPLRLRLIAGGLVLTAQATSTLAADPAVHPATPATPAMAPGNVTDVAPLPKNFPWPSLLVGDRAPDITADQWLKGQPVKIGRGEPDATIVIVEFWALWCGPCLAGMPHLTALQRQYADRGLRIVGITGPDRNNALDDVTAYLQANPERVGFAVGWDTQRKTYADYMLAAERKAIPCSYVIAPDGRIAYIGHPSNLDEVIRQMMAGTFDIGHAREAYKRRLVAIADGQSIIAEYRAALNAKDWERCINLGLQLGKLDPEEFGVWTANAFGCLLNGLKDEARALELGRRILDKDSPLARHVEALDRVASLVADSAADTPSSPPPSPTSPPAPSSPADQSASDTSSKDRQAILDLGLVAAERSIEIAGKNAVTARTLARVLWARGDRERALAVLDDLIAHEKSDFRVKTLKAMRDSWASQSNQVK